MGGTIFYENKVITNQLPMEIVTSILFRYSVKHYLKKEKRMMQETKLSSSIGPLSPARSSFTSSSTPKPRYPEMSSNSSDDLNSMDETLETDDEDNTSDPSVSVEPISLEFNSSRKNLTKKLDSFPVYITFSQLKKFSFFSLISKDFTFLTF
jgi:hypothetical protein